MPEIYYSTIGSIRQFLKKAEPQSPKEIGSLLMEAVGLLKDVLHDTETEEEANGTGEPKAVE